MPYLVFETKSEDIDLWESIFSYLEDNPAAAHLQNLMDKFGKVASEKLESLIDEYGGDEAFNIEFWNRDGTEFSVMVYSPSPDHEDSLMELLSSCPITNLRYGEDTDL